MSLPGMPTSSARRRRPSGPEAMWRMIVWVSGVFFLLVALVMLGGHVGKDAIDPLKSPQLRELKEKLRMNPPDEQIKQQIRALDLQGRQRYFHHLTRIRSGVYMLLGGVAVFIFAFSKGASYQKRLPMPNPNPHLAEQDLKRTGRSRCSVAIAGAIIGVALFALSLGLTSNLADQAGNGQKSDISTVASAAGDAPSSEELRRNWPRFRGPEGSAVTPSTNMPVNWDVKTGSGINWSTAIPAKGFSSPIIWGQNIFLSGGDTSKREVFCFALGSGQLIWRQAVTNVPGAPAQPPEIPETTGYASSSMATDGRRVYSIFATGDLAAFTLEGKQVWAKSFGPLKNPYGYATSLATWKDRLVVQLDQGEAEENKSKLYALDGRNGQMVWQTPRKVGSSWASPIVIEAAGKQQIITLAVPWVISYDTNDGKELWRVEGLNGEITPSPVFAGGLLFIVSPSDRLMAIRPDGQGDVTKTHIAWTSEENVPDVTSPVGDGELVFTITTGGLLTCFDAKDGKKLWEHDFETDFHASPSIAGNKLYLFSQKGAAIVVEVAREFKQLARIEMGDSFHASPAFAQDKMILRGVSNLWCIGTSTGKIGAGK
jgi:outer membrane protein assembly factor BamB